MTKTKGIKSALVTSVVSLFLCVAMLVGTTFAWFTDTVTSANNIIQTGTLDIGLSYSDDNSAWTEVTEQTEAIFNYQYWEPGYTDAKYIKISNNGTLAFKYQLNIVPNITTAAGDVNLADVIDVYLFDANVALDRDVIAAATPVGTLSDLMAENDGAAHGVLLPAAGVGSTDVNANESADTPRGEITYCVVLKMQETAGNEYQNLSVGNGFALQLLATQYTWENDSFDHLYDDDAVMDVPPKATVVVKDGEWLNVVEYGDWNNPEQIWANKTFQFQPNQTEEEALNGPDALYHADFVVYADKDIPAGSIILPGYYEAFGGITNGSWVGLSSDEVITAGTQIRLVELLGVTVNYSEICKYGNDGTGFLCGISAVDGANGEAPDGIYDAAGTTITVELRLYEVGAQGDCAIGGGCKHPSVDCETGNYEILGTYTYTIPTAVEATNP